MKKSYVFLPLLLLCVVGGVSIAAIHSDYGAALRFYDSAANETVEVLAPVYYEQDFITPVIDATNDLTVEAVNSGAAAITAGAGGLARLTTGAADDDDVEIAGPLVFQPGKGVGFEARVRVNDVSGSAVVVGLTDDPNEAADTLALTYATTTLTSTATNCAAFFWDPDGTTDYVRAVGVNDNTDGTILTSTEVLTDEEWAYYRIEIDQGGTASFYINGAWLGTQSDIVSNTSVLCCYVGSINREGSANTVDVDYIRAWQESR